MMTDRSIFEIEIHPLVQAGCIIACIILFSLIGRGTELIGLTREDPIFPWIIAVTFLLFFAIGNSVMGIAYKNQGKYAYYSMIGFGFVALAGGTFAYFMSGVPLSEAKSIKWIYIVFSMGYVLFFTMIRAMRRIVQIAQKQDSRLRGE